MKKFALLLSSVLLMGGGVFFTSCSDDDNGGQQQGNTGTLYLTNSNSEPIETLALPPQGSMGSSDYQVYVRANNAGRWTAELEDNSWCDISSGSIRITVNAEVNLTDAARSTRLIVTTETGLTESVTLTQEPYYIPFGEMTYEDMIGTYQIDSYLGEDMPTSAFTVTFTATDDFIDDSGFVYPAYDVTGWGRMVPELYNDEPARAVFYEDRQLNCNYVILYSKILGEKTVDVVDFNANENGTVKKNITSSFHFAGNMINVTNAADQSVGFGPAIGLFAFGNSKEDGEIFMTYNEVMNSNNGNYYICTHCGYWYEGSDNEAWAADFMIVPNLPDCINRTTSSVKMLSSLSSYNATEGTVQAARPATPANLPALRIQKIK